MKTEIEQLRECLASFLALFNEYGDFQEAYQDQASRTIENAETLLRRTKKPKTEGLHTRILTDLWNEKGIPYTSERRKRK